MERGMGEFGHFNPFLPTEVLAVSVGGVIVTFSF